MRKDFVLRYNSWNQFAMLNEEFGNKYPCERIPFGVELDVKRADDRIDPSKYTEDYLIFEQPLANAKKLRLELDCKAIGKEGTFAFLISREYISKKSSD